MTLDEELQAYDRGIRQNQDSLTDPNYRAFLSRERIRLANLYDFEVNQFNDVYRTWREYRRERIQNIIGRESKE